MGFEFRYRRFAEALYSALAEDAFYATMECSAGEGPAAKEAMLRYLEFSMIEGEKYGELYTPKDHDYGVSIWAKPLSEELAARKSSEKKRFLLDHMGEESSRIYHAIVEFMSAKTGPLVGEDFWYLSIVGILPGFQGRGLGSELVKGVLHKTDQLDVPTYLETFTPRNISFYARLGYRAVECFHEPTTDAEYWLMIREPSNA